jgi:hypothetical protein
MSLDFISLDLVVSLVDFVVSDVDFVSVLDWVASEPVVVLGLAAGALEPLVIPSGFGCWVPLWGGAVLPLPPPLP